MTTHAKLSPSSAYRWTQCPASAAIAAAEPRRSSFASAEGTAAHELHQWCLTECLEASAYIGRVIEADGFTFTVDKEMADHVQSSVDRVTDLLVTPGSELMVEVRVAISSITGEEGAGGTADSIVFIPRDDGRHDLHIVDLKYGAGVVVDAERNLQLAMYAEGAIQQYGVLFDVADVYLRIHQPRRENWSTWSCTRDQLAALIFDVKAAARTAINEPTDGQRNPGDHCKFCPVEASCEKRIAFVSETVYADAKAIFEQNPPPVLRVPPLERLAVVRHRLAGIRDWCNTVEAAVDAALDQGQVVPGWKRVAGQEGNRTWANERGARDALVGLGLPPEELYTEPKLKSPAQVEKLIPKEARKTVIPALVTRSPAKPVTVPLSDPRPPFKAVSASDFDTNSCT